MSEITIAGCGPGNKQYASLAALQAIEDADVVIGAARLIDEFATGKVSFVYSGVQDTLDAIIRNSDKKVVVLVTGDPGFFSITACILSLYKASDINIIPGISSVTFAFNRLGIPWHDALFLSAHKSLQIDFSEKISSSSKSGILTSPQHTPSFIGGLIDHVIAMNKIFYVCERLSYPDEKISVYSHDNLCRCNSDELSVLVIVNKEN